jgi:cell wall-associated NlpC family hydrolase
MPEADEGKTRANLLEKARAYIGTPYSKLDCSHFVHDAYKDAGLEFPYSDTKHYDTLLVGKYFRKLDKAEEPKPGDLVLFSGHVGIYDPDGCSTVHTTECKRLSKQSDSMRLLSARGSGKPTDVGVEYGQISWWSGGRYLRWVGFGDARPTEDGGVRAAH